LTSEHLTFAKMIEAGDSKVTQIFHNTKLLPTETLRAAFEKHDADDNGDLDLVEASAALKDLGLKAQADDVRLLFSELDAGVGFGA